VEQSARNKSKKIERRTRVMVVIAVITVHAMKYVSKIHFGMDIVSHGMDEISAVSATNIDHHSTKHLV
uniref:Uncharacterized protein n=1 Tax=Parascaris univalens TaxID=6257 RepID=A0A915B6X9_PARUN